MANVLVQTNGDRAHYFCLYQISADIYTHKLVKQMLLSILKQNRIYICGVIIGHNSREIFEKSNAWALIIIK